MNKNTNDALNEFLNAMLQLILSAARAIAVNSSYDVSPRIAYNAMYDARPNDCLGPELPEIFVVGYNEYMRSMQAQRDPVLARELAYKRMRRSII